MKMTQFTVNVFNNGYMNSGLKRSAHRENESSIRDYESLKESTFMQNSSGKQTKYHRVDSSSLSFKLFLVYDIFMVFIIIFNLFCLAANFFLMSSIGAWFFEHIHLPQVLSFYRTHLHPWVITSEAWFIGFLIIELLVRWGIAIVYKHHKRWFFFPFIHWYEILAIIPQLRFLRLSRAGIIAYRLHELGYPVIPESWRKTGLFITVWLWKSCRTA